MEASPVLNSSHLVVGFDSHCQAPPPLPPLGVHIVAAYMGQADPTTSKASLSVKAGSGQALGRQHDLGRGRYHIAGNPLLPLVWAGAANKAEFGCASVIVGGCGSDNQKLSMATALGRAGLGLQLDCGEPAPLPSSLCIASFNTVRVGVTNVDVIGGIAAMATDTGLTWAFGKVAGVLATGLQGKVCEKLGNVLGLLGPPARSVSAALGTAAARPTQELVKMVIGWFIGTPVGYSYEGPLLGGDNFNWHALGNDYGSEINNRVAGERKSPDPNHGDAR